MDDLTVFIDRLIAEKGLEGLSDEVLFEAKNDLIRRVEQRMNAAVLEHMPADKLEEFSALLDKDDAEAIQAFTAAQIPDLNQILAAELLDFRSTYLNP